MKYHAHIYWNTDIERTIAISMRPFLESMGGNLGRIYDTAIGPHPIAMYQVKYDDNNKDRVETFIKNNHKGISVLLHTDTGNDLKDHTENVVWLGEPIDLDLTAFMENK